MSALNPYDGRVVRKWDLGGGVLGAANGGTCHSAPVEPTDACNHKSKQEQAAGWGVSIMVVVGHHEQDDTGRGASVAHRRGPYTCDLWQLGCVVLGSRRSGHNGRTM